MQLKFEKKNCTCNTVEMKKIIANISPIFHQKKWRTRPLKRQSINATSFILLTKYLMVCRAQ